MRLGLGKIGRAVSLVAQAVSSKCADASRESAEDVNSLLALSQKLEGYGKDKQFIEYEPMKSLKVGGFDLHKPLNEFLGAWKQEPVVATRVGQALAKLLLVLKQQLRTSEEL